jgi:co-chaperonin GroES (HSP10)
MTFAFGAKKVKVRALPKDILVINMDMGEQVTDAGIVIASDDGKAHGVKPRWAEVYKVGNDCGINVKEGQWVLIEHGRWTRKIKIDDGLGEKEFQKVEVKSIVAVSDQKPNDFYIGQEYSNGSSMDISPEDFMPGNLSKIGNGI